MPHSGLWYPDLAQIPRKCRDMRMAGKGIGMAEAVRDEEKQESEDGRGDGQGHKEEGLSQDLVRMEVSSYSLCRGEDYSR